jgi:nitrate reductase gamma subunit
MKDDWLFALAPYLAGLVAACVFLWRCARGTGRATPNPIGIACVKALVGGTCSGCVALTLILVGHVALLAAPASVLRWNQSLPRLLTLEAAAFGLAVLGLAGVALSIRRHVVASSSDVVPSTADVMLLTLVGTEIVSGIALALFYRWGSSWAAVTVAPYTISIVKLAPRVQLVASTPFLVRLHVFCTFAIVAVAPFSALADLAIVPLRRRVRAVTEPLTPLWYAAANSTAELTRRMLDALSLRVEEES